MSHLITAVLAILFSGTTAIDSLNSVDMSYTSLFIFSPPCQAPPVMAYPATTPTGMIGYGIVSIFPDITF